MGSLIKPIIAIMLCAALFAGCDSNDPAPDVSAMPEDPGSTPAIVIESNVATSVPDDTDPGAESIDTPDTEDPGNNGNNNEQNNEADDFYVSDITDDIAWRIKGRSYKEGCPVALDDLRYIHVLHKDINGTVHEGEMICNAYIADDLIDIFRQLYDAGYPIEKIRLVDEYDADDEASMEDNNSSCFNFRYISNTTKVSKHGLGLAVDINTLYNPYIKQSGRYEPVNAGDYTDRTKDFDYKIEKGDLCYELFTGHGFEWGGNWKNSKDYQHFEIPDSVIEREGLRNGHQ